MPVQTVPYQPTAEDNAVGVVPLSDAEANAIAKGQMQPGVSLDHKEPEPHPSTQPPPAKPEIPEKFMRDGKLDQEALLKSYQELERKLGQPKEPATDPDVSDPQKTQEGAEASRSDQGEADKEPATGDDRFAEFAQKITQTGGLEEADFAKLAEMGIPRQMAETYVNGFRAQVAQAQQQLFESAGIRDKAEFDEIAKWGSEHLSQAEKDAFDKAVADPQGASWALQGLKARYVEANGRSPRFLQGDRAPAQVGYESREEYLKELDVATRTNDPGLHQQIQRKLAAMPTETRRAWLGGIDTGSMRPTRR